MLLPFAPKLRRSASFQNYMLTKKNIEFYETTGTYPSYCFNKPFPYKNGTAVIITAHRKNDNLYDCVMLYHTKDGCWRDIHCTADFNKQVDHWTIVDILADDVF